MMPHPTLDALEEMRLRGMAQAYAEQLATGDIDSLDFDERFALIVERERLQREQRALTRRLQVAKLRVPGACLEDVDLRTRRGLKKAPFMALADCGWIRSGHHVVLTGPTGIGKTWLACALGNKACREGFSVRYLRLPRLLSELAAAHGDGSWPRFLDKLAKCRLLILDDWGLAPLDSRQRRDLHEIFEDRHDRHSTLIASQYPIDKWHELVGDPTIADSMLDRIVANAYEFALDGPSMRGSRQPPRDSST